MSRSAMDEWFKRIEAAVLSPPDDVELYEKLEVMRGVKALVRRRFDDFEQRVAVEYLTQD